MSRSEVTEFIRENIRTKSLHTLVARLNQDVLSADQLESARARRVLETIGFV